MSAVPTGVLSAIDAYIQSLYTNSDQVKTELLNKAKENNFPDIHISEDEAKFLQFLIQTSGMRTILEIGLLGGFSAISMAEVLPSNGRVTSIEIEKKYIEFAESFIKKAGLSDNILIYHGNANQVLLDMKPEPYDFIFIDADKTSYQHYFEICLEKFSKRGTVLGFDNAFAFGKIADLSQENEEISAIRALNKKLFEDTRISCTIIPVGDGLLLARVI